MGLNYKLTYHLKRTNMASVIDDAIKTHDMETFKTLLADFNNNSQIHGFIARMIEYGFSDMLEVFIRYCDEKGTAIYFGSYINAIAKDVRIADAFLRGTTRMNDVMLKSILHQATISSGPGVMKRLLEDPRIDPSYDDNLTLRSSILQNDLAQVKMLIADSRVDPSIRENWCIRYAASALGNAELVRVLMQDPRVDPSANNNECLRWAMYSDNRDLVHVLLTDKRVDPSIGDNALLQWAVKMKYSELVSQLRSDSRVDSGSSDSGLLSYIPFFGGNK